MCQSMKLLHKFDSLVENSLLENSLLENSLLENSLTENLQNKFYSNLKK